MKLSFLCDVHCLRLYLLCAGCNLDVVVIVEDTGNFIQSSEAFKTIKVHIKDIVLKATVVTQLAGVLYRFLYLHLKSICW